MPENFELDSAFARIEEKLATIETKLAGFNLLQQQLAVMERMLDSIVVGQARVFNATLNPEAVAEERRRAQALAKELAEESERMFDEILANRKSRGIPNDGDAVTDEDILAAEREFS